MSSNSHNPLGRGETSPAAEETLRLMASLPTPEGLENRIHLALRSAPRGGIVLSWPVRWMRAAAAAGIVIVVAGGGWGIYSRVQQNQPGSLSVMPIPMAAPGGFSGAGAIRTPQTLAGPVVSHPAKAQPAQPKTPKKKTVAHAGASQTAANKAATQPSASPAH